ncbi:MAG TPA: metallophosphoesterase [Candidatus Acidoferrales bacterium]|nr:metallophosphoesterase [Candidatus Acidoferrales bacterium]
MRITRRSLLSGGMCSLIAAQTSQDDWQGAARVVAVGDIHGDCDALVAVLKMAGVLDDSQHWVGGRTHLVQVGDIPARGPQTREAYDLLMRLEPEASGAGGRLHPLIGNHDAGNMYGDLRNVLPEEYGEFREAGSEERLAKAFEEEVASLRKAGQFPSRAEDFEYFKKTWFERHPPGFVEHRAAFGPTGKYGSWIRKNNAVIRINDTLFVHGGISPKYARTPRSVMNGTIRRELQDPSKLPPGMTTDTQGPLWYRGLAEDPESPLEAHLRAVLRFHGVNRIVIGHAVTRTAILPRFGGRVVNIDLGLSRFYGRPPACLVLEGGAPVVLHRGVRIPLPGAKPGEFTEYCRAVIAADTKPSPVEKLLEDAGKRR